MILRASLSKATRCCDCRVRLVDPLIALNCATLRPAALLSSSYQSGRHLTQTSVSRQQLRQIPADNFVTVAEEEGIHEARDEMQGEIADAGAATSASNHSTPWYLQVDTPRRDSKSLLDRQKLPELPEDPPPLLQPILEHVFMDLGLDDLVLLDLRRIDPPPALGANLLMLIGTARSEKHLHVSADRFCRWMKTTHNIVPFADGLLGRGELKLRLKRKARRARILSRVGSAETNNTDDGIRTGWICVTLEGLEDGKPPGEALRQADDYIGFGAEEGGAKVVIQMLTQDKREDLDLETLWGQVMRRHLRKEDRISKNQPEYEPEHEVGQRPLYTGSTHSDAYSTSISSPSRSRVSHRQIRHIHSHLSSQRLERGHSQLSSSVLLAQRKAFPLINTRHSKTSTACLADISHKSAQRQGHKRPEKSVHRLRAHVDHLYTLPIQTARLILNEGITDDAPHEFIHTFKEMLPLFPAAAHWACHLDLFCYGVAIEAPGYDKLRLQELFGQIQTSLVEVPYDMYVIVLRVLLNPIDFETASRKPHLSASSLEKAVTILEDMSLRGHDIATEEIRSMLEIALARTQSGNETSQLHTNAAQRLRRLMDLVLGTLSSEALELQKLHAFADVGKWDSVWDVWHGFGRDMRRRSPEVYVAMLERLVESGSRVLISQGLRNLMAERRREEPPVVMDGPLAQTVMMCLRAINPNIENEAMETLGSVDEQHRLWRQCEDILSGGGPYDADT